MCNPRSRQLLQGGADTAAQAVAIAAASGNGQAVAVAIAIAFNCGKLESVAIGIATAYSQSPGTTTQAVATAVATSQRSGNGGAVQELTRAARQKGGVPQEAVAEGVAQAAKNEPNTMKPLLPQLEGGSLQLPQINQLLSSFGLGNFGGLGGGRRSLRQGAAPEHDMQGVHRQLHQSGGGSYQAAAQAVATAAASGDSMAVAVAIAVSNTCNTPGVVADGIGKAYSQNPDATTAALASAFAQPRIAGGVGAIANTASAAASAGGDAAEATAAALAVTRAQAPVAAQQLQARLPPGLNQRSQEMARARSSSMPGINIPDIPNISLDASSGGGCQLHYLGYIGSPSYTLQCTVLLCASQVDLVRIDKSEQQVWNDQLDESTSRRHGSAGRAARHQTAASSSTQM